MPVSEFEPEEVFLNYICTLFYVDCSKSTLTIFTICIQYARKLSKSAIVNYRPSTGDVLESVLLTEELHKSRERMNALLTTFLPVFRNLLIWRNKP